MLGLLSTALTLVGAVAPLFTSSTQVAAAIKVITEAAPLAIQAGEDVWAQIKPAIAAVRQSGAATADQLAELDTVEAEGDAAFDSALADAKTADAAASGAMPKTGS